MPRHGKRPRRGVGAEPRFGDQIRELASLTVQVAFLVPAPLGPAPLMPAQRRPHRYQQPAVDLHAVGELGVFATVAVERLVEAARRFEQDP